MDKSKYAKIPFDPARLGKLYGWLIILPLSAVGVLMSAPGQTIGISTFTDSLIAALDISRNELSFAYMFGTIGSSLMLTWAGKQYDVYGVRSVATIASVMLGLVLLYLSSSPYIVGILSGFFGSKSVITFLVLFFGFLFLRFFGQGILTLVSRNMAMKWFDSYRGTAAGINNVFVSIGFSLAPVVFSWQIDAGGWQGAWRNIALVLILLFPVIVLVFFRDNPEIVGLEKDGGLKRVIKSKKNLFVVYRDFSLKEARGTAGFWIFALFLAFQGLYYTGFTFHVTSIFANAGLSKEMAVHIFIPSAVVAAMVTVGFSVLSDYLRLKILLYVMGIGAFCSTLSIVFLGTSTLFYYLLIAGNGILVGIFGVISSTVWPRFYGNKNLGAISGSAMTMIVFASALGPIIFSGSLFLFQNYQMAAWLCFGVYLLLTLAAIGADNPQEKLKPVDY